MKTSLAALSTTLVLASAADTSTNLFEGASYYVNPSYQTELDSSISTASGTVKSTLQSMRDVPSAYWLDVKSKITGDSTDTMEGILKDAAANGNELVTFIVYDLPNRDCDANASNGEICCTYNDDGSCNYDATGDCADGLKEYQTTYIDPIVTVLKEYDGKVPIVLVIEPDSLPNLATNTGNPHCGNSATEAAYKGGIAYAVEQIGKNTDHVSMYLDAAHGGWLGWSDNMDKFASDVNDLGVAQYLRGFSTNVANYQPLGEACPASFDSQGRLDYCLNGAHSGESCCSDSCNLIGQWNPANNEMNYAQSLAHTMSAAISGFEPHMIIDTGRNGVDDMRSDCSNWCNIRGAGVGSLPTTKTGNSTFVDAYFWLKTPGESDGCTQTLPDGGSCARYDSMCGSADSLGSQSSEPAAPEAGHWFDYQIKQLAENAHM